MTRLVRRHNHAWAEVWEMTPKRIVACLHFAEIDARRERAEDLTVSVLGSRGDSKAVKKQHAEWTRD